MFCWLLEFCDFIAKNTFMFYFFLSSKTFLWESYFDQTFLRAPLARSHILLSADFDNTQMNLNINNNMYHKVATNFV